jgi:L-threonylcarbamoyladenylate synthase
VDQAVEHLCAGGLVALPTETVYGLAADATNRQALERLYRVKGRPRSHPVIVHVAGPEALAQWASEVPEAAHTLAQAFWPGPLTLVLKRAEGVLKEVTGGADTVALRSPSHPVAQAVLAQMAEKAGDRPVGLAAPSANRFGRVSPTTAAHVLADLGGDVDLVLDGGPCEIGIESTIVDVSGDAPAILRPGGLSAALIEKALRHPLATPDASAPAVPGSLPTHYAPRAKLQLVNRREIIEALATNRGRRIAVLALEVSVPRLAAGLLVVVPVVPAQYAKNLYANLRTLDATGADIILVETPPSSAAWAAVQDRLRRAATRPPERRKGKEKAEAAENEGPASEETSGEAPEQAQAEASAAEASMADNPAGDSTPESNAAP